VKPETRFTDRAMKALRAIPESEWIKIQQVGKRGDADVFGVVSGLFYSVEIKTKLRPIKRYEKLQMYKQRRIAQVGGAVVLMTQDNWRHHIEQIRRRQRLQKEYGKFGAREFERVVSEIRLFPS